MAMVVRNNMSAVNALNTLNRNGSELERSLRQVSTGMRINSAGDNASWYAISERMRVHIRGLSQDVENVQTGNSLLRVADGAIASITDNLREMKRMALNAANDTNTDADRATIQKEFAERSRQIDDIASTTNYNGKVLLDGRYRQPGAALARSASGGTDKRIGKAPGPLITRNAVRYNQATTGYFPHAVHRGSCGVLDENGQNMKGQCTTGASAPNTDYHLDFSGVVSTATGLFPTESELDGEGFTLSCNLGDGCCMACTVVFDASMAVGTGDYDVQIVPRRNSSERFSETFFTVGVQGVADGNGLLDAVWAGILDVLGGTPTLSQPGRDELSMVDPNSFLPAASSPDGTSNVSHYTSIYKTPTGYYVNRALHKNHSGGPGGPVDPSIELPPLLLVEGYDSARYKGADSTRGMGWDAPLVIHSGTKAGQNIKLYLNDMHSESLGIANATVETRESATGCLSALDGAIQYTLDEATRVGAYMHRMDITERNLTIAHENVTASESVLRDADMAKAMTEYTRSSVLVQSTQAMLAQANQNSSGVMSLLQ